ncbi:hypothetical protein BXY66_3497 [Shimia isoporae]|uniref:Aminoglycoside phosphotransferase domain-containing protein n=1 Tax=Shimia isoporae TaxID=647720 RepID=A0A4R1N304_9RHOB|nr:phosphotransferase [Shimia isoporae]TCK99793.1 hypothetical protein BXY66_3497 [Shimia isoporae]
MPDRSDLLAQFVEQTDWRDASRTIVAGDASNRRYDRLKKPNGATSILMDAPPEKGEDVRPFIEIAQYLRDVGVSAPDILEADVSRGFLIIEDLGDALFAKLMATEPNRELELYQAATDVLLHLHSNTPPDTLEPFDASTMASMIDLAFSWYTHGADSSWADALEELNDVFPRILQEHVAPPSVFMHRDYHVENLLWLPDRAGTARVGVIDFQDAKIAHPAYDLVSLLQDARRDVPKDVEAVLLSRYISRSGQDPEDFLAAYHVLGAQRNLRILGVFARLCMHFGKPHYLQFIPRVYSLLMRDLDHPALVPVAGLLRRTLPDPTPQTLKKLKEKCATFPMP